MRCVYPSDLKWAAAEFDRTFLTRLLRVADAEWVVDGESHGGKDIAEARLHLPTHAGGFGIREISKMMYPAFIAGACAAVPALTDHSGVDGRLVQAGHFPGLKSVIGPRAFAHGGGGFHTLVAGGASGARTRLGRELAAAVDFVQSSVRLEHAVRAEGVGLAVPDLPADGLALGAVVAVALA